MKVDTSPISAICAVVDFLLSIFLFHWLVVNAGRHGLIQSQTYPKIYERDSSMDMLKESEAAQKMRMSSVWLRKARQRGYGPSYVKLGGAVRYPASAVEDFIKANMRGGI